MFVKDGFSWAGGPVRAAVADRAPAVVAAAGLRRPQLAALQLPQLSSPSTSAGSGLPTLALNVLVGFEADTLRRWALERRGWHTLGTVSGKTATECERRFFDAWLPNQPILTAGARSRSARWRWPVGVGTLLGARS